MKIYHFLLQFAAGAFIFKGSDTNSKIIYPKQYVYHLIDKMKNTIKPFSLNVDFNKLEKVHF
jgi:hypothetical protein